MSTFFYLIALLAGTMAVVGAVIFYIYLCEYARLYGGLAEDRMPKEFVPDGLSRWEINRACARIEREQRRNHKRW